MTPKTEANALIKKHYQLSKHWDCWNDEPNKDIYAAIVTVKTIIRTIARCASYPLDEQLKKHYSAVLKELKSRLPKK